MSLGEAVRLFREGRASEVKETCRQLAGAQDSATPGLLLAAIYFEDRNFPAAIRALQELPARPEDREAPPTADDERLPDEAVEIIMTNLERHPNALRPLEHGIPVFEHLRRAAPPSFGSRVDEALHEAYRSFLKDQLEERRSVARDDDERFPVMKTDADESGIAPADSRLNEASNEQIGRLLGYLARARGRFPADEVLVRTEQILRDVLELRARTARSRVVAAIMIALAVVCGALGLLTLGHRMRLNGAHFAIGRGDYATAVADASSAMAWGLSGGEARRVRAEANYEWARSLFSRGEPDDGLYHIDAALRDDPGNVRFRDERRRELTRWARRELQQGRFDEACDKYRMVLAMGPDPALTRLVQTLEPWARVARLLLSAGSAGRVYPRRDASLLKPITIPRAHAPAWLGVLRARGLVVYGQQLQIAESDLDGDGANEIIVGGSDWPGPGARSGLSVYEPAVALHADGALRISYRRRLRQDAGRDRYFSGMQLRRLTSGPPGQRPVLVATWLRKPGSALGHSVFIWGGAGRLHVWRPPHTEFPAQIRDQNRDGRPEVWLQRMVGDPKDPDTLVGLPIPYQWMGGGALQKESQDFSDYYLDDLIPDLERQSRTRFGPHDPRRARFDANCRAAIAQARALAHQ